MYQHVRLDELWINVEVVDVAVDIDLLGFAVILSIKDINSAALL